MSDESSAEHVREAVLHVAGDATIVRESQVGRLEAASADVSASRIGSVAADRASVSGSQVGFAVGRDVTTENTQTGVLIAFTHKGTVTTQVDARVVVLGAAVLGATIAAIGRLLGRR